MATRLRACEALVIGAGPAGLTAAVYLARFRRDLVLIDAGESRARYIPESRNCPGFAHGVSGPVLLDALREQAVRHGIRARRGRVVRLVRKGSAFVARTQRGALLRARTVILATGVVDRLPPLDDVESAIRDGVVRLCPICDAYETARRRVGVFGPAEEAVKHARYLRSFSSDVVALIDGAPATARQRTQCQAAGVGLVERVGRLERRGRRVLAHAGGETCAVDVLYAAMGAEPNTDLARALGARRDAEGEIVVDAHQRTSVPGLYAIGDVVRALNQIAVGTGHAAIAATAIHNELPQRLLTARR